MFKEGATVKIASKTIELELSPYINTSKLFRVVSSKPYGWVEIVNEDGESIITQARFLKEVD